MLAAFLIMLREGLEAALIIGIIAAYLRHAGKAAWLPAIWIGVLLAAALALFAGSGLNLLSREFPQKAQEAFEALVGLIAVGMLTTMVLWMRRAARDIGRGLEADIDQALATGPGAVRALIGLAFFAVAREGLEAVFFLLALFQQSPGPGLPLSALAGLLSATGIGWLIYRCGIRIRLGKFFRISGIFILFVAAGLLAGVLQNLYEAGLWIHLQQLVFDASESLAVTSLTGTILAALLGYDDTPNIGQVLVWTSYLLITLPLFLRPVPPPPRQDAKELARPAQGGGGRAALSRPPRRMGPALCLSAGLFLLSAGLFSWASGRAVAPSGEAYRVEVGATSCAPMDLSVPAGRVAFTIHNRSDRPIEWEILDGPMVVEERENILPGLQASLSARLKPGNYQITCGLLSNPRGSLTVLPSAASEAERKAPPATAFIGALSEYRVFTLGAANALVKATTALETAIRNGDRDAARTAWLSARLGYKRIEPMASRFAALENAIDPLPDYLAGREADPAYAVFHPIEAGLRGSGDLSRLQGLAARLQQACNALRAALKAAKPAKPGPADLAALAQRQARLIAEPRR